MEGWSIRGDVAVVVNTIAGVTYGLDNTERSFAEMRFAGWQLRFASLADDSFSYTVRTANAKGKGTIVPRDGQQISIFHDGVRKFKGTVVRPMLGLKQLKVTAYGPWWWMGKISLSGATTDETGASDDRTSYVFPTQNLRQSIQSLVNRAEFMGVPMARLEDADMPARVSVIYNFLKTTLSNMSYAAALAELLGNVPDAVAWWDYTDSLPKLNVTRRDALTRLTYEVGGEGYARVESADIYPRTDQKVQRVELKFVERQAVTGKPRWAAQNFGTVSTATHKRQVQIVTISGPETLEVLKPDDADSVEVQTRSTAEPGDNYIKTRAATIASNITAYGNLGGIITGVTGYDGWSWERSSYKSISFPGIAIRRKNGDSISLAGRYLLLTTDMPEWLRKELNAQDVVITGTWGSAFTETAGQSSPSGTFLDWNEAAPLKGSMWANPYSITGTARDRRWWAMPFECDGILVNGLAAPYAALTKVYQPWDYDYLTPPPNLAANLRAAQAWVPWEGPVVIVSGSLIGNNPLDRKICLSGSHPDHADMDALVRSATFDHRQRLTLDLGSPARTDLGGLVNKMRRNPQDNIVWL